MASSDPPGADTSSVAAAPPSGEPPPPSSSSSSKRRWSPCTWRYAIEDAQPELGSRPRSNSNSNPPFSASSLRAASSSDHAAHPPTASSKSRLHHPQDQVYGKDQPEEPLRRSAHPNRTWGGVELSELRARQAQPRAHDTLSRKKRPPHPQSNHQQQQKESVKRRSPKGEEEEQEEEEEEEEEDDDDGDGDGDDAELGHHFEEGKKQKKREMSPSELYYCEICRAEGEATKGNIASNSPPPPSEDP